MANDNDFAGPKGRKSTGSQAASDMSDAMEGQEPLSTEKPSQAEGDRETVDQALEEQEVRGELY
jgi:hypothetical protein